MIEKSIMCSLTELFFSLIVRSIRFLVADINDAVSLSTSVKISTKSYIFVHQVCIIYYNECLFTL